MDTISNPQPTQFEQALAAALLAGDLPLLDVLREQWRSATFETRELSGAGFFLKAVIPSSLPRADPPNLELGDVSSRRRAFPMEEAPLCSSGTERSRCSRR